MLGYFAQIELHAEAGFVPINRLHANQVDDAFEFLCGTDRHRNGDRIRRQAQTQLENLFALTQTQVSVYPAAVGQCK